MPFIYTVKKKQNAYYIVICQSSGQNIKVCALFKCHGKRERQRLLQASESIYMDLQPHCIDRHAFGIPDSQYHRKTTDRRISISSGLYHELIHCHRQELPLFIEAIFNIFTSLHRFTSQDFIETIGALHIAKTTEIIDRNYYGHTLILPIINGKVLLGQKKKGFGKGYFNGFGGKIEAGESIKQAAIRELYEECSLQVTEDELIHAGTLNFLFRESGLKISVDTFLCDNFSGQPFESDEMKPEWFSLDKIPYTKMWPDDLFWLPGLLSGQIFRAFFLMGKDDRILEFALIYEKSYSKNNIPCRQILD